MIPDVEQSTWVITIYWLLMLPIAVWILVRTTDFWADDGPATLMEAVGATLVTALVVFLTYDFSGYVFALLMQVPELGFVFPQGYGYLNWFREPLCLKWQVLSFIPVIRYLPIIFAFTAAGTLQVVWWKMDFRMGVVAFFSQLVLLVFAMAMLSVVFSFFIGVSEGVANSGADANRRSSATNRNSNRNQNQVAPQAPPVGLPGLQQRVREIGTRKGPFINWVREGWTSINGTLEPVYNFLAPITKFLPLPAQDFMNGGGWLIALPGIGALGWYGWKKHQRRKTRVPTV
ncbi:MAG: hypothetical protein MUF23_07680 [Pirellula sp.]|jgi:hypothetical protein|nr:hypothetical protein [Pirellula sp.]